MLDGADIIFIMLLAGSIAVVLSDLLDWWNEEE